MRLTGLTVLQALWLEFSGLIILGLCNLVKRGKKKEEKKAFRKFKIKLKKKLNFMHGESKEYRDYAYNALK